MHYPEAIILMDAGRFWEKISSLNLGQNDSVHFI